MKKNRHYFMIVPVLVLLLGLSGCYYEGGQYRHGDVYLALEPDPDQWVQYYWDNNASVPDNYQWGYFYPTQAGLYEYEYALGDGWVYFGTYYLERELGHAGGPGYASVSGNDRFYSFYCLKGGGYTDWMYLRHTGMEVQAQMAPDTVVDFGGYEMKITRNRVPAEQFESVVTPKFRAEDMRKAE